MEKILVVSGSEELTSLTKAVERAGFVASRPGETPAAVVAAAMGMGALRLSSLVRPYEKDGRIPLLVALDPPNAGAASSVLEIADDFILKPFDLGELALRLHALLRKSRTAPETEPAQLVCGDLVADRSSLTARVAGELRSLSVLEFRLLWFLMKHAGNVASRGTILKNVWKGTIVSNRTIDAHIVGLRRALRGMRYRIETIYGAGYSLRMDENQLASA